MSTEPTRPVVLLTGASTGLGLAITQQLLAQTRYRLILTARPSSMHRFGDEGITETERIMLRPLDVTSAEQRERVVREAHDAWGGVDILINNAGLTYRAVFEHIREEDRLLQVDVNFRSPTELARLVLPGMRAKRHGRIINISSAAGLMAMPTMGAYSASKFALEGATEALWYEAKPWNIKVSLVQPGFINSKGFEHVKYTPESCSSLRDGTEAYSCYYRNMAPFIETMMRRTWATSEKVAQIVLRTMQRRNPPLRIQATWDVRVFSLLRRFLPQRLYHWVLFVNLPKIRGWVSKKTPRALPTPAPSRHDLR